MEWGQGPPGPPGPGPGGWGQGPPSGPGWDGPPPGPGWDGPPPGPGWGGPPGPCGPGWGPNPNDVEYVDADEQRPGSKMANAFCLCCVGILLFPVALMVLGYNEVNSVCTHEKILYGQKMAEVIGCEPRNAWYQNMVVYMSCPVHEDSLQVFTPASFNSMSLQDAISFRSTSGSQKAEMYQCVETYRTEKTRDKETIKIYSYSMEWKSQPVDSSHFAYNGQAQAARDQGCPYFRQVGNPSWPADLPQSSSQNYAQSVRAGPLTIGHRLIAGEDSILGGLEPDQRVQLSSFASRFRPFNQLAPHPPAGGFVSITPQMAAIDPSGQYIVTCAAPTIGCLRISYKKNSATTLSVLSGVEGGYTKPIEVPSSWGCSPGQFDALIGKPMSLTQFAGKFEERIRQIHGWCDCLAWDLWSSQSIVAFPRFQQVRTSSETSFGASHALGASWRIYSKGWWTPWFGSSLVQLGAPVASLSLQLFGSLCARRSELACSWCVLCWVVVHMQLLSSTRKTGIQTEYLGKTRREALRATMMTLTMNDWSVPSDFNVLCSSIVSYESLSNSKATSICILPPVEEKNGARACPNFVIHGLHLSRGCQ